MSPAPDEVPIPPPRDSRLGEAAPADKGPITLARLTSILEHLTDFVLQIDEQGRIAYINRIYPPYTREQVLGSQVEDWVTPEFRGLLDDAVETYRNERQGRRLSFIAFKQVPWYHHARFAAERSQL